MNRNFMETQNQKPKCIHKGPVMERGTGAEKNASEFDMYCCARCLSLRIVVLPVRLSRRNLLFSLRRGLQLVIAPSLGMEACVHFTELGAESSRPCEFSFRPCVEWFFSNSKALFPSCPPSLLALQSFNLYFHKERIKWKHSLYY